MTVAVFEVWPALAHGCQAHSGGRLSSEKRYLCFLGSVKDVTVTPLLHKVYINVTLYFMALLLS